MALSGYLGQDELGGHTFQQDDGSTLYVPDIPEARQLAARLSPQPDMRTAQAAPMQPDIGADPSNQQPAPPPMVADVPQASGATGNEPGVMRSGAIAAGKPVIHPDALPTLPVAGAPTAATTDPAALSTEEEALLYRRNPGSPAVTQAQLAQKATQGTLVPRTGSVETSGAIPMNPEAEALWTQAKRDEYLAKEANTAAAVARASREQDAAQAERIHLENQMVQYKAHQQKMQWEADAKAQALKDFDTEAQARYADFGPQRFFKKNGGTFAIIAAAIAQGLGAYAAIMTGGQNHAANIINAALDREVQSQRDEYLRDKDARANLVGELHAATGDLDMATEGAKAVLQGIVRAHGDELAALSKRDDVIAAWNEWRPQFEAGIADHYQKAYEKGLGNVVIKSSGSVEYPHGASDGGPLTIEQLARREEAGARVVEARRKRLGEGAGNELEIAPGVYARDKTEAKDIRNKLADIDATDKELAGLQSDTKAHPMAARVGSARYPLTSSAISDTGANIASRKNIAVGGLGQLSGSGVVNPGEFPRLVKSLDTPAGIQGVRDTLRIKRDALLRGHSKRPLPPEPTEKK